MEEAKANTKQEKTNTKPSSSSTCPSSKYEEQKCCHNVTEFACSGCLCVCCPIIMLWSCVKISCSIGWRLARKAKYKCCCWQDKRVFAVYSSFSDSDSYVKKPEDCSRYTSAYYVPFRDALDSNPRFGDKKTYQLNPANSREALVELREDESEGADIVLVKPGVLCLDIIQLLRNNSSLPIAAYQVSGEYTAIKLLGQYTSTNEEQAMMEPLMAMRHAGANIIVTYFALQAARSLCGEK